MTSVETTVTISSSPEGMSLVELEAQIGRALQQAGQELLLPACRVMEANLLERGGPVPMHGELAEPFAY